MTSAIHLDDVDAVISSKTRYAVHCRTMKFLSTSESPPLIRSYLHEARPDRTELVTNVRQHRAFGNAPGLIISLKYGGL